MPEQKITYEADGWFATVEEDDFQNGCSGKPICKYGETRFVGRTLDECIAKCCAFVGVDPNDDAVSYDCCEEPGRLDIQHMENDNAYTPTSSETEAWKQGEVRLWLADYTFLIYKVTREVVSLTKDETKPAASKEPTD